jgi:plastocyanin
MKRTVITISIFLVLALISVGCSSPAATQNPPAAQNTPVPQTGGSEKEVKIASFAFDPAELTVPVGTTVKWTNMDQADHTVTADDKSFDSGSLSQGKSFSFTFTKEGTYTYKCSFHSSMVGKIVVTK